MKILQASVKDANEILNLQKSAFQIEAEIYNNYDISPLKETIEEISRCFKTHVFLKAEDSGKIVGAVRAFEKDETCYIGRLAVSKEMQNRGIGTLLMKEIEKYFKPKRFELFTGAKSEKNIRLYKKLGYSPFGEKKSGCGGLVEVIFMEKIKFCKRRG